MPPLGPLRSPRISAPACHCGQSDTREESGNDSPRIHIDPGDRERRFLGSACFQDTPVLRVASKQSRLTFGFAQPMLAEAAKLLNTNEGTD